MDYFLQPFDVELICKRNASDEYIESYNSSNNDERSFN